MLVKSVVDVDKAKNRIFWRVESEGDLMAEGSFQITEGQRLPYLRAEAKRFADRIADTVRAYYEQPAEGSGPGITLAGRYDDHIPFS